MHSIPIEVLRMILEHVDKADLVTLCRVNRIFCSCSQDVLYRHINTDSILIIRTLAQSTDLARRVRSFECPRLDSTSELATALNNMSLLRTLSLGSLVYGNASFLDGCTFKLESFQSGSFNYRSLRDFLNIQSSIIDVQFTWKLDNSVPFEDTCLPNLTQVVAYPSLLRILIPGRPVRSVIVYHSLYASNDCELSFFTLSTAPIQKLTIPCPFLFPKPGSLLVSLFPSLVHLTLEFYDFEEQPTVRLASFYLFIY
jgi:hypothetical protein